MIERLVLDSFAQELFVAGAIDRQQTADARQREAQTERDRLEAFRRNHHYERKTFRAVRQTGGNQPQSLDRDPALDVEQHNARVLALLPVEEKESAAAHASRLDDQADARRRLEAYFQFGDAEIAALFGEGRERVDADAIHQRADRAD